MSLASSTSSQTPSFSLPHPPPSPLSLSLLGKSSGSTTVAHVSLSSACVCTRQDKFLKLMGGKKAHNMADPHHPSAAPPTQDPHTHNFSEMQHKLQVSCTSLPRARHVSEGASCLLCLSHVCLWLRLALYSAVLCCVVTFLEQRFAL